MDGAGRIDTKSAFAVLSSLNGRESLAVDSEFKDVHHSPLGRVCISAYFLRRSGAKAPPEDEPASFDCSFGKRISGVI